VLVEAAGTDRVVHLDLDGAAVTARCPNGAEPRVGSRVPVSCDPFDVHVFADPTGERLGLVGELAAVGAR
jgi:hypothetical protein